MELNKIILADCMDVMKDIPDKYFELAIVDPPYGKMCDVDSTGNSNSKNNGFSKLWLDEKDKKDKWNELPNDKYFKELFRISVNQIIWGGNYFQLPISSCWLVWDKGQRDFTFADAELGWTSFKSAVRIFEFSRARMMSENKIHPTQKPVALYKWLLKNYAKQGDKILDTHSGSGTTAIACIDMGFDYVCIEKDKDYYEASVKRISKELIKIKMF